MSEASAASEQARRAAKLPSAQLRRSAESQPAALATRRAPRARAGAPRLTCTSGGAPLGSPLGSAGGGAGRAPSLGTAGADPLTGATAAASASTVLPSTPAIRARKEMSSQASWV